MGKGVERRPWRTYRRDMLRRIRSIKQQVGRAVGRLRFHHVAWIACLSAIILVITWFIVFFWPRQLTFQFDGTNCVAMPTFLPNAAHIAGSEHFSAELQPGLTVAGYTLYSPAVCIHMLEMAPHDAREYISITPFGLSADKKIEITMTSPPSVRSLTPLTAAVANSEPLIFDMSSADIVFEYVLHGNNATAPCRKTTAELTCDLAPLQLAQSQTYDIILERTFKDKPAGTALQQRISTVEAVHIISSSITAGSRITGVPNSLTLTANKPLSGVPEISLTALRADGSREPRTVSTTIAGPELVVTWKDPLPRDQAFELALSSLQATDRGYLPQPFILPFSTSGGPKVTGVNIGGSRVVPGGSYTITLDTPLAPNQPLAQFVTLRIGATAVAASVGGNGRTITVTPATPLPRCTGFSLNMADGLRNDQGVSGGSSWSFRSQTICQTVFGIGTSVQGRAISGYKFGTGPSTVVFIGTAHGNEKSATASLNNFIDYLETHATAIPASRSIVVIPNMNPDGYTANRRTNAHDVDLNRNFAANNWKAGVTMPDKSFKEFGGGTSPMSEPESRAVANYLAATRPRLTLTYHSIGPLVAANEAGDSRALASIYGKKVGYASYGNDGANAFDYDTTGALEDWMHDKLGLPAILIELSTRSSNEFNRHRDAMWTMATTP